MLVVIAGYLVWLRSKYQPTVPPTLETEITTTPSPEALVPEEISTPSAKEATGSMKEKTSTGSSVRR